MQQIRLVHNANIEDADGSYGIRDASIDGDILVLRVAYSGGCEKHAFELVGSNELGPPSADAETEVRTYLAHNSNGDSCKQLVTEELCFDLSPLKAQYREVYRTESGSVVLLLLGRRVNYRF
jgi:hypothetical protein